MSQREGFAGGFVAGAILGSIVGGVVGAVLASRSSKMTEDSRSFLQPGKEAKFNSEESIEMARRRLEDKIAQLNLAIDDVRQQLDPIKTTAAEPEFPSEH